MASHTMSKVLLLDPRSDYTVGDVVRVRVDMYDTRGWPLHRGGDQVRVWLRDQEKKAGVAGHVTDLNNGSYVAEIPVRWPGVQQVM